MGLRVIVVVLTTGEVNPRCHDVIQAGECTESHNRRLNEEPESKIAIHRLSIYVSRELRHTVILITPEPQFWREFVSSRRGGDRTSVQRRYQVPRSESRELNNIGRISGFSLVP